MKMLKVDLDVWKWQGVVLVGGTVEDFAKFAKNYINADLEVGVAEAGRAYLEKGQPWLVWVESLKDVANLAHEALHIAAGVLEARGLKFETASEEAYTYTMERIISSTLTAKAKQWTNVAG